MARLYVNKTFKRHSPLSLNRNLIFLQLSDDQSLEQTNEVNKPIIESEKLGSTQNI